MMALQAVRSEQLRFDERTRFIARARSAMILAFVLAHALVFPYVPYVPDSYFQFAILFSPIWICWLIAGGYAAGKFGELAAPRLVREGFVAATLAGGLVGLAVLVIDAGASTLFAIMIAKLSMTHDMGEIATLFLPFCLCGAIPAVVMGMVWGVAVRAIAGRRGVKGGAMTKSMKVQSEPEWRDARARLIGRAEWTAFFVFLLAHALLSALLPYPFAFIFFFSPLGWLWLFAGGALAGSIGGLLARGLSR